MSVSIKQHTNLLTPVQQGIIMKQIADSMLLDLTALRTTVAAIRDDTVELRTRVNNASADILAIKAAAAASGAAIADIGALALTASGAAALTSSAPAALTTTS